MKSMTLGVRPASAISAASECEFVDETCREDS
jgi:hypothetical protein